MAGDALAAEASLRQIDRTALLAARKAAMDAIWSPAARHKYPAVRAMRAQRSSVGTHVIREAFARDHFTCRYCGRQTIHLDVLKLLSRAFPDLLPYDPGWKPVEALIVFWTHASSIEHHIPLARGGTNDALNIVTACYQCNDVKNYYLVEEIGWSLLSPAPSTWDGLTGRLPGLRAAVNTLRPVERSVPSSSTGEHARGETRGNRSDERLLSIQQNTAGRVTADCQVSPIRVGALVSLRLPLKKSSRSYRVESVDADVVSLREMWREGPRRTWVESKNVARALLRELAPVEVVYTTAPRVGSTAEA